MGTILIPDTNTPMAHGVGASPIDWVVFNLALLSQHGELLADFHFQAPAKRGRSRGSKTKKCVGKAAVLGVEGKIKSRNWDKE